MLTPNFDLQALNTLAVPVRAAFFTSVSDEEDLRQILLENRKAQLPLLVLGGGSNVVLTSDFPGIAIKNEILGRDVIHEDEDHVWLRVGAGENWHKLVLHCLDFHYWGLENLSLIPGSVGAAPIQNIGAYGVELKDVFSELEAIQVSSGLSVTFDKDACRFGYRDSIFKGRCKDQYIITSVTLKLFKEPSYQLDYPGLAGALADTPADQLTPQKISSAVCKVRSSKLPSTDEVPNVGSFFKNPVISRQQHHELKELFPNVAAYDLGDEGYKVAAGWLIDQCGWKGKTLGGVGVHQNQALVLTNPGRVSGYNILKLAENIQSSVLQRFSIELEVEPRIYP